jgi:hypothetical protein
MGGLKTVYGRDGTPIADIRTAVIRSSLLNDVGEAIFSISTFSNKCRRELLEYGNFLLVQHDQMPDWVGMIDTPRTWRSGLVEVHAYEAMSLLNYRLSPVNTMITGLPSELVNQLVDLANSNEDTLIRMGRMTESGVSASEMLTDTVLSHIKGISKNYGHDWICTPAVDSSGRLTISMDWLERAGIVTDLELSQGRNILYGDTPLEESGEILNYIHAMSNQQSESPTSIIEEDSASRSQFGLRAARKEYITNQDDGALPGFAQALIRRQRTPDIATPLTVVNVGNTFKNIRLGNVVKYKYTNVGFDGDGLGNSDYVRIMGYRFDEARGTVELFTGKVL